MAKNQIFEMLAVLGTSAVMLGGCGGAPEPVKASDVPAAMPSGTPEATPTPSAQPAPVDHGAAPAPKADATPTPSGTPAASPGKTGVMPMAKDMPKGNHTTRVQDSKRAKPCQAGCGEGTCGAC